MVEFFLAAPPSSAQITQRRHPEHSSALTQHRQDLATSQQLLRAFLAFKLLLMIMGDIHSNQSKHGFFFFYFGSIKEEMQSGCSFKPGCLLAQGAKQLLGVVVTSKRQNSKAQTLS